MNYSEHKSQIDLSAMVAKRLAGEKFTESERDAIAQEGMRLYNQWRAAIGKFGYESAEAKAARRMHYKVTLLHAYANTKLDWAS